MFYQNRMSKEMLDTQMRISMDGPETENISFAHSLKIVILKKTHHPITLIGI